MAGGPKATTAASGIWLANARLSAAMTPLALFLGAVAIVPGLQRHEEEAHVRRVRAGQQAEPGDRVVALDRMVRREDRFGLLHHGVGSFERRAVGQQRVDEDVALVLLGHEPGGNALDESHRQVHQAADQHQADDELPHQHRREADVAVRDAMPKTLLNPL